MPFESCLLGILNTRGEQLAQQLKLMQSSLRQICVVCLGCVIHRSRPETHFHYYSHTQMNEISLYYMTVPIH